MVCLSSAFVFVTNEWVILFCIKYNLNVYLFCDKLLIIIFTYILFLFFADNKADDNWFFIQKNSGNGLNVHMYYVFTYVRLDINTY